MIHPTDFDSTPPAGRSTTGGNVAIAWTVAGALALLSAIAGVAWQSASKELRTKTMDLETVQSQIREITQQRDALQAQVSSAQRQSEEDAARRVRVTVTAIRLFSVSEGARTELADTAVFDASTLQEMTYHIEGIHPICGSETAPESIAVRLVMPDGTMLRTTESTEDATSSLTPDCAPQAHQWTAEDGVVYDKPGDVMVGSWQLLVIDRGTIVGRKSFEVR